MRKLDVASQRAIQWMFVRFGCLLLLWAVPLVSGTIGLGQFVAGLVFAFSLSSVLAVAVAGLRREALGGASLNTWDEAILFSGLAALAHVMCRLA